MKISSVTARVVFSPLPAEASFVQRIDLIFIILVTTDLNKHY